MKTVLYDRHVALGAKFISFGGWELPLHYSGAVVEHMAVRNCVGLFDISHMGRIDIRGPSAGQFIDYFCTNRLLDIPEGSAIYAVMCHVSGGSVDDILAYCVSAENYFIVANGANREKDLRHLIDNNHLFQCTIADRFSDIGILALQGPQSLVVAEEVFQTPIVLRPMHFTTVRFQNTDLIVSRSGYTGSIGFELFAPLTLLGSLWDALLGSKCVPDILPCGLAARDLLRLEAGYALYGHELSDQIAPDGECFCMDGEVEERGFHRERGIA